MKGLIIKDIRLVLSQRVFLVAVSLASILLALFSDNPEFAIPYASFLGIIYGVSTLNMDESSKGLSYLMTLPVTRKGFVKEKYIFTIVFGLIYAGAVTLLCMVGSVLYGSSAAEVLFIACTVIPWELVLLGILFPVYIKFGTQNGRLVVAMAVGLSGVALMGLTPIIYKGGALPMLNDEAFTVLLMAALSVIWVYLSYRISVGIMERKEF